MKALRLPWEVAGPQGQRSQLETARPAGRLIAALAALCTDSALASETLSLSSGVTRSTRLVQQSPGLDTFRDTDPFEQSTPAAQATPPGGFA